MNLFCGLCIVLISLVFGAWIFPASAEPPSSLEEADGAACAGQIEPRGGENFAFAQYKLWLPADPQKTAGILSVVLHPHGEAGVRFDDPAPWVKMAARHQCALLSISFVKQGDDRLPWCRAASGTGRALLQAIDDSATERGLPNLREAPLVVAGICEAGQFAYEFAAFAPRRVRAFLTMGGARHRLDLARQAAGASGLLIAPTDRNEAVTVANLCALFSKGQKAGAPWIFSAEPIGRYDEGGCSELSAAFLETSLAHLDEQAAGGGTEAGSTGVVVESIRQRGPPMKDYPANTASQLQKMFSSDAVCRFVDGRVAKTWQAAESNDQRKLSFVSVPLHGIAVVQPRVVELGTSVFDGGLMPDVEAKFTVQVEPEAHVDDVKVVSGAGNGQFNCHREEEGKWKVECRFQTTGCPCGGYSFEVPIRCFHEGRTIAGGLCARVIGQIRGDIRAEPTLINFDESDSQGGERLVRFRSASGARVELLGIGADTPKWIRAEVKDSDQCQVRMQSATNPPSDEPDPSTSGYLVFRVRGKDEETIKVLCHRKEGDAGVTQ